MILVLALGCSAGDAGEDVGQLEQALTPCTLQVTALTNPFNTYVTWKVKNVGQACGWDAAIWTELVRSCPNGCVGAPGKVSISLYKAYFTLPAAGIPGWHETFIIAPKPTCYSGETVRPLASWIPTPGAARKYVAGGWMTCPL
jgi:hypothetical protein